MYNKFMNEIDPLETSRKRAQTKELVMGCHQHQKYLKTPCNISSYVYLKSSTRKIFFKNVRKNFKKSKKFEKYRKINENRKSKNQFWPKKSCFFRVEKIAIFKIADFRIFNFLSKIIEKNRTFCSKKFVSKLFETLFFHFFENFCKD